jgi:DNA invertase Pin-like site-specific DNA recombinase
MKEQHGAAKELPQAVVYLRSATPDRTGNRTAAARHLCEQRANELGAVVVTEYIDTGSGLTDERSQLTQMLGELADADITYVIVPEHSTIARNMHVYARIIWKIEQAGARLIVASAPLEDYPAMKSNPLGLEQAVADWANNETQDAPAARRIRNRTTPPDPTGQNVGESPGVSTDKEVHHD